MSNGRLFQTVGPVKEKDLSPKIVLFVVGTQSMKLSQDEHFQKHTGPFFFFSPSYQGLDFQSGFSARLEDKECGAEPGLNPRL